MIDTKLTAIVLAGGKAKPAFTEATGVTNRALVELAPGKTMLDYVIDGLTGSETVGKIFVVGDVPESNDYELIAPGQTLVDNILAGLKASEANDQDKVLLVSSDIPFIKPSDVDSYVADALEAGADFCYPIIPMDDYNRQFSEMKRTTLKLTEGEFTGGNIMLVRAGMITSNSETIHAAYAARKSPIALGKMLGWGLLLKIVISQIAFPKMLNIPTLEKAVGKVLGNGVMAKAVITKCASIGTDIDDAKDVEVARRILG